MSVRILQGDCRDMLKTLPNESVDAVVTDPPYGLRFMGKHWDYDVPGVEVWAECLRALKPGGHLLAFAGTRTQHRMAVNIEDAGFDIRDMIAWVYGNGFPKSMDVSKAIDKAAGAEREVTRAAVIDRLPDGNTPFDMRSSTDRERRDIPATAAAAAWQGWGTALKPALEPITVARKPFAGTVAGNVLQHGTGALNIDACRVEAHDGTSTGRKPCLVKDTVAGFGKGLAMGGAGSDLGRYPANLIHDGSPEVVAMFPDSAGSGGSVPNVKISGYGDGAVGTGAAEYLGGERTKVDCGSGSAARFFYCAKASKSERGEGNNHPTVKPLELMRYLCRLVTPAGGLVLDPFMGSGTTALAAMAEGFSFVGIEREAQYVEIAKRRIEGDAPLFAEVTHG